MKKLCLLILISVLFIFGCNQQTESDSGLELNQKPNILIIYWDDLGYGDVGSYGGTNMPTPNMDRLAREGIRFTNGYA